MGHEQLAVDSNNEEAQIAHLFMRKVTVQVSDLRGNKS